VKINIKSKGDIWHEFVSRADRLRPQAASCARFGSASTPSESRPTYPGRICSNIYSLPTQPHHPPLIALRWMAAEELEALKRPPSCPPRPTPPQSWMSAIFERANPLRPKKRQRLNTKLRSPLRVDDGILMMLPIHRHRPTADRQVIARYGNAPSPENVAIQSFYDQIAGSHEKGDFEMQVLLDRSPPPSRPDYIHKLPICWGKRLPSHKATISWTSPSARCRGTPNTERISKDQARHLLEHLTSHPRPSCLSPCATLIRQPLPPPGLPADVVAGSTPRTAWHSTATLAGP